MKKFNNVIFYPKKRLVYLKKQLLVGVLLC